jgi:transcriptional regulator with XRE-family HTH domain
VARGRAEAWCQAEPTGDVGGSSRNVVARGRAGPGRNGSTAVKLEADPPSQEPGPVPGATAGTAVKLHAHSYLRSPARFPGRTRGRRSGATASEAARLIVAGVDEQRLGAAIRAVRRRRKLSQKAVGVAARVGHSTVSLVERGHCGHLSLATIGRIAAALDLRVELAVRWRGGELDRLLNRRHSLLAESFAARLTQFPGWVVEPEVSFAIYGERGVIDQLAWHAANAHLLLVELKTELVDVNELLGTLDRKRRLSPQIAMARGWSPKGISVWLVVADTTTNRRHAREHATLLRSRLPEDGRRLRRLLGDPSEAVSGVAFWSYSNGRGTRQRS